MAIAKNKLNYSAYVEVMNRIRMPLQYMKEHLRDRELYETDDFKPYFDEIEQFFLEFGDETLFDITEDSDCWNPEMKRISNIETQTIGDLEDDND